VCGQLGAGAVLDVRVSEQLKFGVRDACRCMQVHACADVPWTFDPQLELKQNQRAATMKSVSWLCVSAAAAAALALLQRSACARSTARHFSRHFAGVVCSGAAVQAARCQRQT
jgi:hypothetical protein